MKNTEFKLEESYGFHFNVIFSSIRKSMEIKLKPYDLTHLQFGILMNLYKNNATTQKDMLRYTNGDEASITRLLDRLESKGYLKRIPCTNDKRKKRLQLTKSGISLTQKIIECAKEMNNELIKNLQKDEAEELLRLLQKVHHNMLDL